jgi:hypothetical protein
MRFFQRKKQEPKVCPECHQLLDPDALECDMCGFDMREAQPAGTQTGSERQRAARRPQLGHRTTMTGQCAWWATRSAIAPSW